MTGPLYAVGKMARIDAPLPRSQRPSFVPPNGPWMADVWDVFSGPGDVRRASVGECAVSSCDRVVVHVQSRLCHAHSWQWNRNGRPEPVDEWLSKAREPQQRAVSRPSIDFTQVPPLIAEELRYVVGVKILRGDWTPNRSVLRVLRSLLGVAKRTHARSFLDRRPEDWILLVCDTPSKSRALGPWLRSFFRTLHRSANPDPWQDDHWLWRYSFEELFGDGTGRYEQNIHWDATQQEWLRAGMKALAKDALVTGRRAWATISTWAQASADLSAYLIAEGIDSPGDLDRNLFLAYLEDSRASGISKHSLQRINTMASVLADLRQGEYVPKLGAQIYLRNGENAVRRTAAPRPFPPDIVARIDEMLEADPEMDATVRVMMKLTRWGGLRISELVALPTDCLRAAPDGSVDVYYYMRKTYAWRKLPVPDPIAEMLRAQQDLVREIYGADCEFLFPSMNRSSRFSEAARPWSTAGLRKHMRRAFARNHITYSSITGERVRGGEIHRYRHTIATALLNSDWTQPQVQKFLGHQSAAMTAHYAEVTDDTMARKTREFFDKRGANVPGCGGGATNLEQAQPSSYATSLADGYCRLPAESDSCDFRRDPCKTCSFYDPAPSEFGQVQADHRQRLTLFVTESEPGSARERLNQVRLDAVATRKPEEDL